MEPEMQMPVRILQVSVSVERRLVFAVAAIILAPVVEETIFRGILYPLMKQHGPPVVALWATSFFFAAIHANLMTFIPLTFLALVLTWLYERTDTLLAPIVAHAVFNLNNFFLLIYETEVTNWLARLMQSVGGGH
jgi:membrane protease YdiL (CAAX protease family)